MLISLTPNKPFPIIMAPVNKIFLPTVLETIVEHKRNHPFNACIYTHYQMTVQLKTTISKQKGSLANCIILFNANCIFQIKCILRSVGYYNGFQLQLQVGIGCKCCDCGLCGYYNYNVYYIRCSMNFN